MKIEEINNDEISISAAYLLELLESKLILDSLEEYGVDNWNGYDIALDDANAKERAQAELLSMIEGCANE